MTMDVLTEVNIGCEWSKTGFAYEEMTEGALEIDQLPGGVTKTSGGLIAIKDRGLRESPCIRCGSCASACPMGLTPYLVNAAYKKGDLDACEQLLATECIACGSCSFICPARRELSATSIRARDEVRAMIRERSAKK